MACDIGSVELSNILLKQDVQRGALQDPVLCIAEAAGTDHYALLSRPRSLQLLNTTHTTPWR